MFPKDNLAVPSFTVQLALAEQGSEQEWIEAVRAAALNHAKKWRDQGVSKQEVNERVASFFLQIEKKFNREIPIQVATESKNLVLFDESELFLKREIQFFRAIGDEIEEYTYRSTLYELLITRYYLKHPLDNRLFDEASLQRLVRQVIFPTLSEEMYSGKRDLKEAPDLWQKAFQNYLARFMSKQTGKKKNEWKQVHREQLRLRKLVDELIRLNGPFPTRYPYISSEDIRAQMVQIGIRSFLFFENMSLSFEFNEHRLLQTFASSLIEHLQKTNFRAFNELLVEAQYFLDDLDVSHVTFNHPVYGPVYLFSFTYNGERKALYFPIPRDEKNLLAIRFHAPRKNALVPTRFDDLISRGMLTYEGDILLSESQHESILDLLGTWGHELFHVKWVYTLKTDPLLVADWSHQIFEHRNEWEKIKDLYVETYGKDSFLREEWFKSSEQRRVNEVLALAFGFCLVKQGTEEKLPQEWRKEYILLSRQFNLSHSLTLTDSMKIEQERFKPIAAMLNKIPAAPLLIQLMMKDPNALRFLDASFTEESLSCSHFRQNRFEKKLPSIEIKTSI